jgi:glutathione S-transferase
MKLLHQTHSPFSRKVLVFAHEVGLAGALIVEHHETSPTNANPAVFAENPLGKVPVLLRDSGGALFDSDVICAYLDTLHARPSLIPASGEARWRALQIQAISQGIAEAGVQLRWETVRRPEALRYPPLASGYKRKLDESLAWIEKNFEPDAALNVGHIALATALDWLLFRELTSLSDHPVLSRWLTQFRQRASMLATPLQGETVD